MMWHMDNRHKYITCCILLIGADCPTEFAPGAYVDFSSVAGKCHDATPHV
jgi:hypothetical protein